MMWSLFVARAVLLRLVFSFPFLALRKVQNKFARAPPRYGREIVQVSSPSLADLF